MKFVKFTYAIFSILFIFTSVQYSQQNTLRGTVKDNDGSPLIGVNIYLKGTKIGTNSDKFGKYALKYNSPEDVVVFSMVGYKKQETKTSGKTELDIVLQEGVELSEIFVVGTRSYNRSSTESPVAIDVLDLKDAATRFGQSDMNQILQYVAPSFNSNRQSGADGADHIDPATLRGLGPDQTLVLINGKRRHQSSLVNMFGSRGRGNTGTDLNAIPLSAIDRVEILRDGASAQYGSDAIAGVINIVLKKSVNEFSGGLSSGAHSASLRTDRKFDGEEFNLGGNYGVSVGENGFLNVTLDYSRKGFTNRPADPNQYSIYRNQFGDASLENFGTFFNSRFSINNDATFYAFGGFNNRNTDAFAWTREAGSDRNIPQIYPNGFDPHILSNIKDQSLSAGMQTKLGEWDLDFNNTIGVNRFHYFVDGTLNTSLLDKSPTRFDAGGFQLAQNTTSLNFTRYFKEYLKGLNIAFGMEYRIENYEIFAGEEGSWKNYGVIDSVINNRVQKIDILGKAGGAQGFPGFRPENVLNESRTNLGAYVDVELDVTPQWMIGAAARWENYSDFGNTLNAKFATRFKITDDLALRASVSTGFRAPSLAQIYFNSTYTDFVAGVAVDKIIAKNNSTITHALGIPSLKQETAVNGSLGLTATPFDGFAATIDGYIVNINDRIVLTGSFQNDDPDIGAQLKASNVGAAQFFANALDTKTTGVDVILAYSKNIDSHIFKISYAGNFNNMELGSVKTSSKLKGKEDIYFGRREKYFLLASAPKSKMSFGIEHGFENIHTSLRLVYFGKVTLIDWNDAENVYDSKITTDLSFAYDFTKNLSLIIGGTNLFDVYPNKQDPGATESGGLWDAVQMGFSGRFLYGKLVFKL
ncbi:MAG: TonB-dependent receptor [Ignavibacteriales bacterium]|nr:TonB-dependent receptor [Ignavibacteriales bacterium]